MTLTELAALCQRLAETQQNLPVPLTAAERLALREVAMTLRGYAELERRRRVGARDVGADCLENSVRFSQFRGTDVDR